MRATRPRRRICCSCSTRSYALAHPVMPFVTEEIWRYLPERGDLLAISKFPERKPELVDTEAA